MSHCDTKPMSAKARKVCKLFAGQLIKEGKINYMTLKGRRALDDVCELQHDISPCRYSCRLMKDFWKDPSSSDCDLVSEKWQSECRQRASGELVHEGNSHEQIEAGAKHREVIIRCQKE